MLLGTAVYAQRGAAPAGQAPAEPPARGRGPTPEQQAAAAKQDALEKATPQIPFSAVSMPLMIPGHTIGETAGVALDSKKNLYVYSRTGAGGPARGSTAAELFQFDPTGKFVKQWGPDVYGNSFAHVVRVDKYDNVWIVDEGSNMVVKFAPNGLVAMTLGRKPEAIDWLERFVERGEKNEEQFPVGGAGTFGRPTDVAWDSQDNIFVSDGYTNSRVAKMAKSGDWVKAVGTHGSGPDQFSTPHGIGADAKGNIYVADRGNNRIQVYDPDLKFIKSFTNVRAPWTICVSPGAKQYLFTADGNTGHIYKLDIETGNLVGWFGNIGKKTGEFYWVHEIACPSENEIYTGEVQNWRVQHITLKPAARSSSGN